MKRRITLITLLLCTALAVIACAGPQAGPKGVKAVAIQSDGEVFITGGGSLDMPPIEGPDTSENPVDNVLVLDGELQVAQPELPLTFPAGVQGTLLQVHVELGQQVRRGDLIATLDGTVLQQTVAEAQVALQRAEDDRAREKTRRETEYQDALAEAETTYITTQTEATTALRNAQSALQQALLQTPDLALRQAEVKLERARDSEAAAANGYKEALDRPWEPQQVRDGLYQEWQRLITDRELAEMELENAQLDVQVYNLDLTAKRQAVQDAQAKLDGLVQEAITLDTDYTTYDRAIADAQTELAEAQHKLEQIKLYAPWDGIITAVKTAVGTDVSGETTIVNLANVSDLYMVTTNLSENHVSQIHSGQKAQVTLRAYSDRPLSGEVETVLPNTAGGDGEAKFIAYIRLDPSELHLLPGMTGRAEILPE